MEDKKLENKLEDEQLEEVSGGRRGGRGKSITPMETVKNELEKTENLKLACLPLKEEKIHGKR